MSENKDVPKEELDPELEELMDSALMDLKRAREDNAANESGPSEVAPKMWSEEFIKEAASQFESNMASILGNFSGIPEDQITQDQIAQTFSKMAEAAAAVMSPGGQVPAGDAAEDPEAMRKKMDEVSATIAQTLESLSAGSEALQQPTFSDADLANMFQNFSLGASGSDSSNMFVPFMQGMMQSLLSKEVLYPSLKDLVDRYPVWLEENKGKVPETDYERYEKQLELMRQVCAELEPEKETDSEEVKRRRFDIVLVLMQKMQDLGQPPTELVGDMGTPPMGMGMGAPPDENAAQCTVM